MKIYQALRVIAAVTAVILTSSAATGAEPTGYYTSCTGKKGADLLSGLQTVIGSHTNVGYNGLWGMYRTTDVDASGRIWDMYSTARWDPSKQCGSYSHVGACYNREHSMPQSWFNEGAPMKADAFHVYPTDGYVNNQRSNYPYGECANGVTLSSWNGIDALGRLGASTFPGYSGTVWEPDDEYKGDFARSYFYMAACYNDRIRTWSSPMLAGNAYPAFSSWAVDLLMKWHRQDPVSQKELDRNEAVYGIQHNRNPFIDHPELAEHIWGNKTSEGWDPNAALEPTLAQPQDGSAINMGLTAAGLAKSYTVALKGVNLTKSVNVSVSGQGFSVSPTSVSAAQANQGTIVTLKYTGNASATGTLTVSGADGVSARVSVSVTVVDGLPAEDAVNVTTESFTARWVFIGDADDDDAYTIDVRTGGKSIAGYPRRVYAEAERLTVEDLEPATTYTYTVSSVHYTSRAVSVTTAAPVPMVHFLYDGQIYFTTAPGVPSDEAEIVLDAENVEGNITLSVAEPFQLSTDKSEWSTQIVLLPDEDRFYMRLYAELPGEYSTTITATAKDLHNDATVVEGMVTSLDTDWMETFDEKYTGSYNTREYTGTACNWLLTDAGVFADDASRAYEGNYPLRMGKSATSALEMAEDKPGGLGIISFYARKWSESDANATIMVEYSDDHGLSWQEAGVAEVEEAIYQLYSYTANCVGPTRIRLRQTAGARVLIDNVGMTHYTGVEGLEGVESDYRAWDARCVRSQLVIESSLEATATVYSLDGLTRYHGTIGAGQTIALDVPVGLYIVVVDDFSRRVMVK